MSEQDHFRFSRSFLPARGAEKSTAHGNVANTLLLFSVMVLLIGCQTARPLPPANLKEPGWTISEGQAVWHTRRGKKEVAGEFLLATRSDGRVFVQFSKNPFPLVIAQSTPSSWSVEIPTQKKKYSGHGQPPARLIWLYLPGVLAGKPPPKGWSWQTRENKGWRLENHGTGQSIEGFLIDESAAPAR